MTMSWRLEMESKPKLKLITSIVGKRRGSGPTNGRTRIMFCKISSTAIAVISELRRGALRSGRYANRSIITARNAHKTIAAINAPISPGATAPKIISTK